MAVVATPLYLSRIATVVSLQQLESDSIVDAENATERPGESLVATVAGAKMPRYNFSVAAGTTMALSGGDAGDRHEVAAEVPEMGKITSPTSSHSTSGHVQYDFSMPFGSGTSDDDDWSRMSGGEGEVPQKSLMDSVLLALWEDASDAGLFRYDVTTCPTKLVPGYYGFVTQLNEGRASKKRATEFRVDKVCQDFDKSKFHFNKAFMREVLFQFQPSYSDIESFFDEGAAAPSSPNLVIINVSPIEYGHVLLVPRVTDCIPQLLDSTTLLLAMFFAAEANNPYFRVGYNSLGAYATINHLHFQAYYLDAPLAVERAPTSPCCQWKSDDAARSPTFVSVLEDYPVRGWLIEGTDFAQMALVIGQACVRMQELDVPHNLLISDCGRRVFLWPQCYAKKQAQGLVEQKFLDTGVNPACWEIAGHMVLKQKQDFDSFTQDNVWDLLKQVSLPKNEFDTLAALCFANT